MNKRVYKSAQGKTVDMGRLLAQNEQVRAVGNMGVNARGDLVDDYNNVIASKPAQVNHQYNQQVKNHKDTK